MSPDRRPHFPSLEFAIAEAAKRKAAEAHHPALGGHGGDHGGHDGHGEVVDHESNERYEQASAYLVRSAFPNLVDEMSELYSRLGVGKFAYLKDGWPVRKLPGHSKVLATPPLNLKPDISYIGANWDMNLSRKVELDLPAGRFSSHFGRFSRHISKTFKSSDFYGLYVLADHLGLITVVGAGIQRLRREQWEGDPDIQAQALNRAFENPMSPFKG